MRFSSLTPAALSATALAFLVHDTSAFVVPTKPHSHGILLQEHTRRLASRSIRFPVSVKGTEAGQPDFGTPPKRSSRVGQVGEIPEQDPDSAVKISESTKELFYVATIEDIDGDELSAKETVDAWVLENEHLSIKGVLLGGNLMGFVDKHTGKEYLWLNEKGAVGYGANSSAFPLTRGLFLHGGVRMAAVTAEHGLYYDTEWDLDFEVSPSGDSASLIYSIQDTEETRRQLEDPLSVKGFSSYSPEPMKNYPVTDATFIFNVTLRKDEKFLRTECTVKNNRDTPIQAEAWLPQTWPVNGSSQIISHQKKRRIKGDSGAYVTDSWVMDVMIKDKYLAVDMGLDPDHDLPQYDGSGAYFTKGKEGPKNGWVIPFPPTSLGPTPDMMEKLPDSEWGKMDLSFPLQWPSADGGILYDFPYMDGNYHAVSFGDGRGMAYVAEASTPENPHFTKMWSWGNKKLFNRTEAQTKDPPLAAGRPATEYYEPWASAFNTAFFELYQFPPSSESSWEARFVPITEGLGPDLKQHELREVVDTAVEDAVKSLEE